MYKVLLSGFETKEQAEQFVSWYEGQGEQDASYWFETEPERTNGVTFMASKKQEWVDDKTLSLHLEMIK